MKTLQTYLIEAIKPPRLSAKNKELWKGATEAAIMKWLEDNCWFRGKAEIVNGKINIKGDVRVNEDIEEFCFPFGEVTGYFNCKDCEKLKSLKNSPQKVGDYFSCSRCDNLTSLEGAPERVGGDFDCQRCKNLKSLKGAPREVSSNFYCYDCGKKFTGEDIEKICKVKGMILV